MEDASPRRLWAVGRDGLYYVNSTVRPAELWFYRFSTHKATLASRMDEALTLYTPSLSVSPDGQSLIYARQDLSTSDIERVAVKVSTSDLLP